MAYEQWGFARGDQIADGLTAVRLLGGGERYEAYLAFDDHRYSPVVVKVVRPDQVENRAALRGLRREYRLARSLDHPVVLRAFALVDEGPRPHLVLEHLDGPRLSSLLRRHGPLSPQQLLPLGIEVASALHYLSREGLVHLDVKPSNIIMGAPPRLIDLSVARSVEDAAGLDHSVGTDRYLAPEQADPPATGTPGPASDVWGLGATLFEAHAGYRPFEDGSTDPDAPPDARWPQLVDDPRPLPEGTPDDLAKVLRACLDRRPDARPAAAEVAEALEPLLARLPKPVLSAFRPGPR
jgi:eukaryotic-like serine/threonine-protein kinase